jgi:4,5-DOPA dioxygenase extradiol
MKLKMPVLFVGHGSPMNAIEDSEFAAGWKRLAISIPKPESILCISAHWETKGTFFTGAEKPETIHDFGGFPKQLYEMTYPAPGSLKLATEAKTAITSVNTALEMHRGLDHGVWTVLRWIYPEADIPVVQMSIDYTQEPDWHMRIAHELSSLRDKGVLIIGSGNVVHNLRMVDWRNPGGGFSWAEKANRIIKDLIIADKYEMLCKYDSLGMEMKLAVPSPEHFLPLLYILALKERDEKVSFFNDKVVVGSISMTSMLISN